MKKNNRTYIRGKYGYIVLPYKGLVYVAKLNISDLRRLKRYYYYVHVCGRGYIDCVCRREWDWLSGTYKRIPLSQDILGKERWKVIDHINRDVFDNRRANLRQVTIRENNLNRSICLQAKN